MGTQVTAALVGAMAGLVGSIAAIPLRTWLEARLIRRRLLLEYEWEQRRKLKDVIGRHHGRLLDAADQWSARMRNLYGNVPKGWLNVQGRYADAEYYFRTTVYRFLALFAAARYFEREAIFIDARYAEPVDLEFVKYVRSFRWVMADHHLVEGTGYNYSVAHDHFFADQLRRIADAFCSGDGLMTEEAFNTRLDEDGPFAEVLAFFDGLRPDEDRLRWDRVVALHLVVTAFVNRVGYDIQRSDSGRFLRIASRLRTREVAQNLADALPRLGLVDESGGSEISAALTRVLAIEPLSDGS